MTQRRMRIVVVGTFVAFGLLFSGGCMMTETRQPTGPLFLTGEELFDEVQRAFPHLELGKEWFVTAGRYYIPTREEVLEAFASISDMPECRWKAVNLVVAEFQRKIHPNVAVGHVRIDYFPPWGNLIPTNDCGTIHWIVLDPLTGQVGSAQEFDTQLIILDHEA